MDTQRLESRGRLQSASLLIATLALAAALGAQPAAAQTLGDSDDVLSGTNYLVRADDLVVGDPYPVAKSTPAKTEVQYFPLDTEDMQITTSSGVSAKTVAEVSCTAKSPDNTPFPQQTQTDAHVRPAVRRDRHARTDVASPAAPIARTEQRTT